jgi:hypothetical protein
MQEVQALFTEDESYRDLEILVVLSHFFVVIISEQDVCLSVS